MNRDDIKEFLELSAGLKKSSRMLVEEEEDDPLADDAGEEEEDPLADDAGGDEGGDEGGEEGGEEEEEEKEEEVKVTKDDEIEFSKSLDNSLNALFIDIESDALKSAKVQEESYSLKRALLTENEIDVDLFAAETARIIKNADVLLDIEQIVLSKARDYLLSKYDEEIESKFLELMKSRHNIDPEDRGVTSDEEEEEKNIIAPIAVGASGGGAGA